MSFPDNPKVRALAQFGEDAGLARDLYVQMCLYCKRMLSDGHVPGYQVPLLVYPATPERGNQFAKQLAFVGLITEEPDGWLVPGFLARNKSREAVERLSRIRSAAGAMGGRPKGKTAGQAPGKPNEKQVASNVVSNSEANQNPKTETKTDPPLTPPRSGGDRGCARHSRPRRGCPDCEAPPPPSVPDHCGICSPSRRIEDDEGNDLGPCPRCHPSTVRRRRP